MGDSDLFFIINASYPAFFKNNPKFPPQFDDVSNPVNGEIVDMLNLLEAGALVPVKGPVLTTKIFSFSKASTQGFTLSLIILAAIILPPR